MPSRSAIRWITHALVTAAGVLILALHAASQTPAPTAATSSPRRAKSAERIEGAMRNVMAA